MLFEEIDNMVWSGREKRINRWCKDNKVYDEITDAEIEEIWTRETPDDDEPIRLNGKYVWETARRVCDFINAHEDRVHITTFEDYRVVMLKAMKVIKGSPRRKENEANSKNEEE